MDAKKFENRLTDLEQRQDKFDAQIHQIQTSLNALSTDVQGLLSREKSPYLSFEPQALREYAVCFNDDNSLYPHDFVEQFDQFFASIGVEENYKCLAFKCIILTTDNQRWKNSVHGVYKYEELKDYFFRHYWDKAAQNRAASRCKQEFTEASGDREKIVDTMIKWANSLCHLKGMLHNDIQEIIGDLPYNNYWKGLRKPGQSVEELRDQLFQIRMILRNKSV